MKKVTSTLTSLLLCLYVSAQVGTLDDGFNNPDGYVINNVLGINDNDEIGQAIAFHSDGRVVVAINSENERFVLVRYTTLGALDGTFGTGGVVSLRQAAGISAVSYAVTVLSDNKILVAGWSWNTANKDFTVLKLLENGTPDPSFGINGWAVTSFGPGHDEARAMTVQSDGKIVVAGFTNNGTNNDFAVIRLNADGTPDATGFGTGGMVTTPINGRDEASGVIVQSDGKIVVGGSTNMGTDGNFTAVRYNSNGTLDNTGYGTAGIATIDLANVSAGSNDEANAIALQTDGKIVITGMSKAPATANNDVATLRLTTAGVLDVTFNPTGAIVNGAGTTAAGIAIFNHGPTNTDEGARSIAIQSDGKIVVGGDTNGTSAGANPFVLLLVRYNSDGTLDNTTFNGDGVATANINADNEFGYAVKLFGNRIYFAGRIGQPQDLLLAAFENDGSPLPLVLSQFYAQKQTTKVILQWQTTSEEDVKHFVIERSNDGKTYKAIGTVAANGNSTTTKNYMFADASPFAPANNYYRLLMVDADGNYKYSKILIVKFDGQLTTSMTVFPSYVKDVLQVQLPNGLTGNVNLSVIDMNGRVIKRSNLASDGNALSTTIDVSSLAKGVYVLKAQAGNTSVISRFTKQ